jgi:hypothetical protein
MIGSPPLAIVRLSGATWFRGEEKNNRWWQGLQLRSNIEP